MNPDDFSQGISADPQHLRLPHPVRVPAVQPGYSAMFERLLSPGAWRHMAELFKNDSLMTSDVLARVVDLPGFEHVKQIVEVSARLPGGSEVGNLYATFLSLRQVVAPQPFFRIDDSLCELLQNTDLDADVPLDVLNAPYPRFYVEFGQSRSLPLYVPNDLSGMHVLEGAYVEVGRRDDVGPGMYVQLTASPLGKQHALDDATHAIFLPLGRDMSLKDAIHWSFQKGTETARLHGLIEAPADTIAPALECVNFLAKVLLYLGLPEARKKLCPEKTDWLKATSALKSTAKKAKAERKAHRLIDYILITAPPASEASREGATEDRKHAKAHWRRGHYRMQPHGPNSTLRKLLFIRPILVNSSVGVVAVPQYRVT